MSGEPLACPRCAARYELSERFCGVCGMPLTYVGRADEAPITEARERARKVRPQYAAGDLVKVAWARNLAEAELIQGMLLEEGIPSILRRTRGFDVPDFLAAGPRDVLVPQAGREAALSLLAEVEPASVTEAGGEERGTGPVRLFAGVLLALALASLIVALLYQLAT